MSPLQSFCRGDHNLLPQELLSAKISKMIDNFLFCGTIHKKSKSNAKAKQFSGIPARGERCKPFASHLQATFKPPGMTGTGAPVTEQLRCRLAGN
jgi:hypothetical protein